MTPDVLQPLLALPTVAYTGLVMLCSLYWGLVVVGIFDLDGSHGAEGLAGAAKGAGEGVLGAAKGAGEGMLGAAKSAGEGIDGTTQGATEGIAGAVKGAGESASLARGPDVDLGDVGFASKAASAWRVRNVPITLSLSFLSLAGLVWSLLGMEHLAPLLPAPAAVPVVGLLSLIAGGLSARLMATPFAGLFQVRSGTRRAALLGQAVVLSTGRVDAAFGQAELQDGGAGLLLPVRCDQPNALRRGDQALLVQFDEARQAYIIEALTPGRPAEASPQARPIEQKERP